MRDGIMRLPGIYEVHYDAQKDMFVVEYESWRIGVEAIVAMVHQAGQKMGREYLPELLT